jgi:hypothetical protein
VFIACAFNIKGTTTHNIITSKKTSKTLVLLLRSIVASFIKDEMARNHRSASKSKSKSTSNNNNNNHGGGNNSNSLVKYLLVFLVCATILLQINFFTNRGDLSSSTSINIRAGAGAGAGAGPSSSSSSTSIMSSSAYKQSFGLFDDISEPMWNRMRDTARKTGWYTNPTNPLWKVESETFWLGNNLYPNFHCPHIERVGGGEGTKFLCYPHRLIHRDEEDENENKNNKKDGGCLIYSVGCAGDFNFEDAMSIKYNKECEIHVFDPADWTRKNDIESKNIHYHPWGLVSTYDKKSKSVVWPKGRGGGFKTFQESIELLGHQDRIIDIFKIDCEGCEWSTHKDWIGFGKFQSSKVTN